VFALSGLEGVDLFDTFNTWLTEMIFDLRLFHFFKLLTEMLCLLAMLYSVSPDLTLYVSPSPGSEGEELFLDFNLYALATPLDIPFAISCLNVAFFNKSASFLVSMNIISNKTAGIPDSRNTWKLACLSPRSRIPYFFNTFLTSLLISACTSGDVVS